MVDRLRASSAITALLGQSQSTYRQPPLDEVQIYDGAASGNLAGLLEQSAKYGARAFLLNQNP
jgi:hypothetical protein